MNQNNFFVQYIWHILGFILFIRISQDSQMLSYLILPTNITFMCNFTVPFNFQSYWNRKSKIFFLGLFNTFTDPLDFFSYSFKYILYYVKFHQVSSTLSINVHVYALKKSRITKTFLLETRKTTQKTTLVNVESLQININN